MALDIVGPYRILERLGEGADGVVHRAEAGDGTLVALKVFHPGLGTDPAALARWRAESTLGRARYHPDVVQTVDAGVASTPLGDARWIARELVVGTTLRAALIDEGPFPEHLLRRVLADVGEMLDALHAADVLHGDVRPENVFRSLPLRLRLVDFGAATTTRDAGPAADRASPRGSLLYAAPETLYGPWSDVDGRADLYGLGVLLHELASGTHPFAKAPASSLRDAVHRRPPAPLASVRPDLPAELCDAIDELLRSRPADRPRRVRDRVRAPARLVADVGASASTVSHETSFHGRADELRDLRAAIRATTDGRGRARLVVGEAGLGKSRLVDELAAGLAADGHRTVRVTYVPGSSALDTACWWEALRAHRADPATGPRIEPFAPRRSVGAEGASRDSCPSATSLVRALRALADDAVLLLVVEDLHHAPVQGLEVVRTVLRGLAEHPAFVLLTSRPEGPVEAVASLGVPVLPLGPLSGGELRALALEWLRAADGDRSFFEDLERRSGGNPFTALCVLRDARDRGRLRRRADGTVHRPDSDGPATPAPGVDRLLAARVEQLGRGEREVLDALGIPDGPTDLDVLSAVLRRPEELVRASVEALVAHGLVAHDPATGRVALAHDLVRAVVARAVPGPLREVLHGAFAAVHERRGGPDVDATADACLHWIESAEPACAIPLLDDALARLLEGGRSDAALDLMERVLARAGSDGEPIVRGEERLRLAIRRADHAMVAGRVPDALAASEEALRLARAGGDPSLLAQAIRVRLGVFAHAGRLDEALECAREYEEVARASVPALVLDAVGRRAFQTAVVGRLDEALSATEATLRARPPGPVEAPWMYLFRTRGLCLLRSGRCAEAVEAYRSAREAAYAADAVIARMIADHELAYALLVEARDLDEAARYHAVAVDAARRTGNPVAIGYQHLNGISLEVARGDLVAADAAADAGLRAAREVRHVHLASAILARRARVARERGRLAAALAFVREGLATAPPADLDLLAGLRVELATTLLWLGRFEEAFQALDRPDERGRTGLVRAAGATAVAGRALAAFLAGDGAAARAARDRVRDAIPPADVSRFAPFAGAYALLALEASLDGFDEEARRHVEAVLAVPADPGARGAAAVVRAVLDGEPVERIDAAMEAGLGPDHVLRRLHLHRLVAVRRASARHAERALTCLRELRARAPAEDAPHLLRRVPFYAAVARGAGYEP